MEVYPLQRERELEGQREDSFLRGDSSRNPNHFRMLRGEVERSQTALLMLVDCAKIRAVPTN
jgi:hypothetical protein